MTGLDEAQEHCAALVREQDHDRWLTTLFAHPGDRPHLHALYAFNHEVAKTRESVSEPMVGEIRLQWWREAIGEIANGHAVRRHPVAEALAAAVAARSLPAAELEAVIDARRAELYDESPKRFADLLSYADDSGGRLTALAVRVCCDAGRGEGMDDALAAGAEIGRAWALTGLIRALGFQAAMNRIMLPEDELAAAGIAKETIFRGAFPEEAKDVTARMAGAARAAISAARERRVTVPVRARAPLLLAVLADSYLRCLDRAGLDAFSADFTAGAAGRQLRLAMAAARGRY